MCIWNPYLFWLGRYGQGLSFLKIGQTSRSRSLGQTFWYPWKGLVTRNVHMYMKALPLLVRKLWPRLKFFGSRSISRSRSLGQKFWYQWNGLVTGMYVLNMKALSLLVHIWPEIRTNQSTERRVYHRITCWLVVLRIHVVNWLGLGYKFRVWVRVSSIVFE